ncbi:MAG: DUF2804 domain-containing protein [Termitinemataceae bacterium]|nr:MAG: DUF2804 domain-containing protein [Termitinemataceae bacterium]
MEQIEFEDSVPVLDDLGKPTNFGWSRNPVFKYDESLIWTPRRGITESERYFIFNSTHLFVFEVYDCGLLGYIRAIALSLLDKKIAFKTDKIRFPMGTLKLMHHESEKKSLHIKRKETAMDFIIMDSENKIIKVDVPDIRHNVRLRGEVVLSSPAGAMSITTNSPWRNQRNCFQLLSCSPWLQTEGVMQFENKSFLFAAKNSYGIYESSIIARPTQDVHFWAAGSGLCEDKHVSFNVGYGLSDSSRGSENAIFVQGKLHKLDIVTFKIPPMNWMQAWTFTANDGRLEMNFKPVQLFTNKLYMFVFSLRVVQVFGFFSGKFILDDGSELKFKNITGIAERRKTTG